MRAAYDHGVVGLQAPVKVTIRNELIQTTVGRALLSEILPDEVPFEYINTTMSKKKLAALVSQTFLVCGAKKTVLVADSLRSIGYSYSTKSGISICIGDMVIPEKKKEFLSQAYEEVKTVKEQYSEGLLTEKERYLSLIHI